jgi:hypothetical protein
MELYAMYPPTTATTTPAPTIMGITGRARRFLFDAFFAGRAVVGLGCIAAGVSVRKGSISSSCFIGLRSVITGRSVIVMSALPEPGFPDKGSTNSGSLSMVYSASSGEDV